MTTRSTLTCSSDEGAAPFDEPERFGEYEIIGPLEANGVLEARDPALQRHVALRLVTLQAADERGARLLREARAMARIAHPNVVNVFDAGELDGQIYVAMELVRGTTLRSWLLERPRSWREIVETFIATGRGLAAAHDAGLVHRNFKLDSVNIGSDGRPRVADFGMSVECEPREDDTSSTDQLAFCAALWEAMGREPPGPEETRLAVHATPRGPRRGRAPRRVLAVVGRGLERDPDARWPSMTALIDALARELRLRHAWTFAGITAVIAVVSAAATIVLVSHDGRCEAPSARIAPVWSESQRAALRRQLTTVDPVQGASRFGKIAAFLDAGARDWSAMHVDTCRATRIEGRQTDALLDRRMECLDRWLGELDSTVKVIGGTASVPEVDQATHAATSLSPVAWCADARALGDQPPPASTVDRATATALRQQIQEADVAQRASRYDGLVERMAALVAAARALGHEPTLAAALVTQVRVHFARQTRQLAKEPLLELVRVAARARDARDEAFAWISLAGLPGNENYMESARAAVLRAGQPLDLEVDFLERQGTKLSNTPRGREGLALLARARQLLESAGASTVGSPLAERLANVVFGIGQCQLVLDDFTDSAASFADAARIRRDVLGPDSVEEADIEHHRAMALKLAGKLDQALVFASDAVRINDARLGESTALVRTLVTQGLILKNLQRWNAAIEVFDRALRIDRATSSPTDPTRAEVLIARAETADHFGKLEDAVRDLDESITLFDTVVPETSNLAVALFNRGDLLGRLGRCNDAIRDHVRALAVFARWVDDSSHYRLYPLTGQAMCLVLTGRSADAIPLLEQALGLKSDAGDALQVARAKAYLGRARVETGRDVAGGLAMARAARVQIAAQPDGADDLRVLDRWLARHRR